MDATDRGGLPLHGLPDPQRPEHLDRAVGERSGALVETRMLLARARRDRLDHGDPQSERRERERQRRADQAAPDDGQVEFRGAIDGVHGSPVTRA